MRTIPKADPSEIAPFYHGYLQMITEPDVMQALHSRLSAVLTLWGTLPPAKHDHAYADGKWTVKEVLGHIIDTERVMAYRALAFGRGETQPLPGFNENDYVKNALFQRRTLPDLLAEFEMVRKSSILLFANMSDEKLACQGIASGSPVTVRALASVILGHELHHSRILQERYL
ncbi:MAG: hypothetical protein HY22_06845 [[Candidatus Thermochlorobacteriaceae] bacterium GBChlB]|nr:MAG: hypothetical protein HY22_06845 [[Candidatus Thermochlorobacteriaceae] bacterium GBChlB]